MNKVKNRVLEQLAVKFENQDKFSIPDVLSVAEDMGWTRSNAYTFLNAYPKLGKKGRYGVYNLEAALIPFRSTVQNIGVTSISNGEVFIPEADPTFVAWGNFADVSKIIKSGIFYPTYVTGLSGNGKTFMIEQACAKAGREYVRVQISPETDEDDLIGGFRLLNGETIFQKGPVIKAMEAGAILLIDEIDRGTNKIMALQGVLEGKPVLIKKTGQIIKPANGFNVIATANTKGKGSDDGRFSAATIIDEAFLERFTITIEQAYPASSIEKKIVMKHMEKFNCEDVEFADLLVAWADTIRKTYEDDGIDEVISTRRLCHIVQTFSIFNKRDKAVELCVNRFDDDTKEAFLDLYTKVDATVSGIGEYPNTTGTTDFNSDVEGTSQF
jgi:hypothetical protein